MRFPRNEDIVIAEMGLYNDGVILSQTEFYNVIEKYILPLIPQGKLKLVSKNEEYKKCKNGLIEYDEGHKRIYFSQSNKSPYIVCTQELENFDISLLKVIKMHQKELMSNLQIVWNTKKAAALRTREQNLLFSTNTEIAYQLSICGLLCNKKTPDLMREFNAEKAEANKKQYNVKQEEKQRNLFLKCLQKEYVFLFFFVMKNELRGPAKDCVRRIQEMIQEVQKSKNANDVTVEVNSKANQLLYFIMKHPGSLQILFGRFVIGIFDKVQ